ncbi:unnamed protein product [Chrysoparadoxa australica]
MARDSAIHIRVERPVKEAAEKAARDDSRSTASLVEKVLVSWLTEHGYLAETKQGRRK